jgi:hypothetical protein
MYVLTREPRLNYEGNKAIDSSWRYKSVNPLVTLTCYLPDTYAQGVPCK